MSVEPKPAKSTQEISAAYDHTFASVGYLRDTDTFYQWVLNKSGAVASQSLLDIACGEGHLVRFARQRGLQAFGIDLSTQALRMAHQINAAPFFALADGQILPFADHTFDVVTNTGSLEHFADMSVGIREMVRLLRPTGKAVVLLPNSYYLPDIIWHVWRTGYPVSHKQVIERFASFRQWWDLLEADGLLVTKGYAYNFLFPRTKADWAWYRRHPRKYLDLFLKPIFPFNLSYHFLYVCSPAV